MHGEAAFENILNISCIFFFLIWRTLFLAVWSQVTLPNEGILCFVMTAIFRRIGNTPSRRLKEKGLPHGNLGVFL